MSSLKITVHVKKEPSEDVWCATRYADYDEFWCYHLDVTFICESYEHHEIEWLVKDYKMYTIYFYEELLESMENDITFMKPNKHGQCIGYDGIHFVLINSNAKGKQLTKLSFPKEKGISIIKEIIEQYDEQR